MIKANRIHLKYVFSYSSDVIQKHKEADLLKKSI
jgi:hypothetical protein